MCEPGHRTIPADYILWQGIHVCAVTRREGRDHLVRDLPVGHSAHFSFTVDMVEGRIEGMTEETAWLGRPLMESLRAPKTGPIGFKCEIISERKEVIILNCLDGMYGHCLLKLLNAERHLRDNPELGLILLIPSFLRWLAPDGVAEIWSVDLGMKQMQDYHPALHEQITAECARFQKIFLSEAYSHPSRFRIENFTHAKPHEFGDGAPLVTFIWREDRPWLPDFWWRRLRKLRSRRLLLGFQNRQVRKFFERLRRERPDTRCCVAGLGRSTSFPAWIDDRRVETFSPETEQAVAKLYAESRVVVGVHGSGMLLPSGLAGMTIELVPPGKWDCIPEDILFQESDPRLAVFRLRFVPTDTKPTTLAQIAVSLLKQARVMPKFLTEDHAPAGRLK